MALAVAGAHRSFAGDSRQYTGEPHVQPLEPFLLEAGKLAAPGPTLRLACYNIQDFTDGLKDGSRTPTIAAEQAADAAALIERMNPDLLALIEVENADAVNLLNRRLSIPYPAAFITDLGDDKLNLALLSRVPLQEVTEFDFQPLLGGGRPPRGILRAEVVLEDGRTLLVYVVHLKSNWGSRQRNERKRRNALELVAMDAEARLADPAISEEIVIIGDMNVDPADPEFAHDSTLAPLAAWRDLWEGIPLEQRITIPTRYGDRSMEHPPATFDRVFVSPSLVEKPWVAGVPRAIAGGVSTNVFALPGGPEGHVSDHYPIFLELQR